VLRGVTITEGEGTIFGENLPDKSNTPMNCELDWSMQLRAHYTVGSMVAPMQTSLGCRR